MGATPYNAFIFTATETIKQLLGNSYPKMSDEAKSLIAGGVSGGLATLFYNPIELLKVRAQVNRVQNIKYGQEIRKLIKNEGYGGLYKGWAALLYRDVPAWGAYFYAYEFLKERAGVTEAKKEGKDNDLWSLGVRIVAAGIAGQISWSCTYPYDIIKTQIQINQTRVVTIREVAERIYKEEGGKGFCRGLGSTMYCAFLVNAIALPSFEYLNDKLYYDQLKNED